MHHAVMFIQIQQYTMFNIFIKEKTTAIAVTTAVTQYKRFGSEGICTYEMLVNTFLLPTINLPVCCFFLLISLKMFSFNSPAVLSDILMQVQLGSQKGLKTAGETFVHRARFLQHYVNLSKKASDMSILNQHLNSYSPPPNVIFLISALNNVIHTALL